MVSAMESNLSPEDELAIAERAAVAPWIDLPPTPWWYAPSLGLLEGLIVFVLGERETLPSVWYVVLLLVLVVLMGAWVGAVMARRGAMPRLRGAPPEFVPTIRAYFAGFALLLLVVVIVFVAVDSRAAAVVVAVGTTGGLLLYERRYAAAAEAVCRRLA
jgi:uncharacterized protein YneF (UPF0154 family)